MGDALTQLMVCDYLQRGAGVWLCPRGVVLLGTHAAAGGVNAVGDVYPDFGGVCGRVLAGRGLTLARLGGGGVDGGGDWLGACADKNAYKSDLAKHKSAHALALSAGLRSRLAGE